MSKDKKTIAEKAQPERAENVIDEHKMLSELYKQHVELQEKNKQAILAAKIAEGDIDE